MSLVQIVVLAVVQGVTEFLPISSSAHLILTPVVFGWQDQGTAVDVAVHVGSLGAVMLYFRHDVAEMLAGLRDLVSGRASPARRLLLFVVMATVPVVALGLLLTLVDAVPLLRDPAVIAATTILFGILLFVSDRFFAASGRIDGLGWRGVLAIGLAQALALVPGTSRSGITMTAGRFLGLDRREAARFSLLLSMPTILAAGSLETLELASGGSLALGLDAALAAALAFLAAWASIALMMRWLEHASFTPFVIYRLVLGAAILAWLWWS